MTPVESGMPGAAKARPPNAAKATTNAIASRNDELRYDSIADLLVAFM
jgi:hypothetical protein